MCLVYAGRVSPQYPFSYAEHYISFLLVQTYFAKGYSISIKWRLMQSRKSCLVNLTGYHHSITTVVCFCSKASRKGTKCTSCLVHDISLYTITHSILSKKNFFFSCAIYKLFYTKLSFFFFSRKQF